MRPSSQLRLDYRANLLRLGACLIIAIVTATHIVPSLRISELNEGHPANTITVEDHFHLIDEDALTTHLKTLLWAKPRNILIVVRDYPVSTVNEPVPLTSHYLSPVCSPHADCLRTQYPQYFDAEPTNAIGSLVINLTVFTDDAYVYDNAAAGTQAQRDYSHTELVEDLTALLLNNEGNTESIGEAIKTYAQRDRLAANLGIYSEPLATLVLTLVNAALTWIVAGALGRILLRRWWINHGSLLTEKSQDHAETRITQILTTALLQVDNLRLGAVIVPGNYGAAASVRVEHWVRMVTTLTRYQHEAAAIPEKLRHTPAFAQQLQRLMNFAEDIEAAHRQLRWDLEYYANLTEGQTQFKNPLQLDTHPAHATINNAIKAAHQLTRQLPQYRPDITRLIQASEETIRAVPTTITEVNELNTALTAFDRAAQLLGLAVEEIPLPQRYESQRLLFKGRQISPYPRPEIDAMLRPSRVRSIRLIDNADTNHEAELNTFSLEPSQPEQERRKQQALKNRPHYQHHLQAIPTDDNETQSRKLGNQLIPLSDWSLLASIAAGTATAIGYYQWTYRHAQITGTAIHAQRIAYETLSNSLIVLTVTSFSAIILSLLISATRSAAQRRKADAHERQRILDMALLTEDSITLEIAALSEEFPAYAQQLQARFNLHRADYEELLELLPTTHTNQTSQTEETKTEHDDPEHPQPLPISATETTTIALIVRCQALSLWRTADILRATRRWENAWSDEVNVLTTLAGTRLKQTDYLQLSKLKMQLIDGAISPEAALNGLDAITENYRLARRTRAVPLRSRTGKTLRLPLRDEATTSNRYRSDIRALAGQIEEITENNHGLTMTWALPPRDNGPMARTIEIVSALVILGVLSYPISLTNNTYSDYRGNTNREIVDRQRAVNQIDIIDLANRIDKSDETAIRTFIQNLRFPTNVNILIITTLPDAQASKAQSWAQSPTEQTASKYTPFYTGKYERIVGNYAQTDFYYGIIQTVRTNSVVIQISGDQIDVRAGHYATLHGSLTQLTHAPQTQPISKTIEKLFETDATITYYLPTQEPPSVPTQSAPRTNPEKPREPTTRNTKPHPKTPTTHPPTHTRTQSSTMTA